MLRILDHLETGSLIFSPSEGVIAADSKFLAIVRRKHDQVVGLQMEDLTHPDDQAANRWLLDRALETGEPFVLRKRYVCEDAAPQWVENRYSVMEAGSSIPLLIMLSRKVTSAATTNQSIDFDIMKYKLYINNMANGLADMARVSGHELATDLLANAAEVIITEEV